ncbi:hypothetical protein [Bradyrhizobium liaoningense]|uniref:hypothetical protein n=1 Tax=Bradyrhizobium liaoningense TaxID=43992 RepID=UPI0012FE78F9|nr:hypothetical protein [Bradyrhizobium liaoningense]
MAAEDIKVSLESISAKVWPREHDDNGNWLFKVDQLKVLRWEQNATDNRHHRTPAASAGVCAASLLSPRQSGTDRVPRNRPDEVGLQREQRLVRLAWTVPEPLRQRRTVRAAEALSSRAKRRCNKAGAVEILASDVG